MPVRRISGSPQFSKYAWRGDWNFGWIFAGGSDSGDWGCAVIQSGLIWFYDSKQLVPRDSGAGPARSVTSIDRSNEPQE